MNTSADKICTLSFDIEEWFQVENLKRAITRYDWKAKKSSVVKNTDLILEILDKHNIYATFFILGWVAERHPALIREIKQRGYEIASHGYSHKRIYTQTTEQFREETRRSKNLLEDIIGQPILGYRAASYSITAKSLWALDILIEAGFSYDSSIFPIRHDLYGLPNARRFSHLVERESGSIYEYPLSTIRIGGMNVPVGGGGYLRLFPYTLTKWAIGKLNKIDHQPAVVYVHPWELDPGQPRLNGKRLSRFRHYVNLHKTEGVLKSLLADFRFGAFSDLNKECIASVVGQGE